MKTQDIKNNIKSREPVRQTSNPVIGKASRLSVKQLENYQAFFEHLLYGDMKKEMSLESDLDNEQQTLVYKR